MLEIKRMDAPTLSSSMRIAIEDLNLEQLLVLYPGEKQYQLSNQVTVKPLNSLAERDWKHLFPRRKGTKRKT